MRMRDSGMPEEGYWESLFNVPLIISRLRLDKCQTVAELGSGYGTFTKPIAQTISGTLYAFDIDPVMVAHTRERTLGLPVVCELRDVVEDGFGVKVDTVLLFNILHCENPTRLLTQAADALHSGGSIAVIHWCYGDTPRGPSLEVRPRPEQIIEWAGTVGLEPLEEVVDLPPWHYGIRLAAKRG